ncbi:MAG TPA: maleylpyruvate isomerase family mycothiol-dependent enzyme [Candidatus Nanopelagicales bacterium]|jgi:uncharacterized protein (TIGR03083 family)
MINQLAALDSSSARLRSIVGQLSDSQLVARAYPTEWSIADVLSHLGSGAVIFQRRLTAAVAGEEIPADYAPGVWATWNAKSARAQADDTLIADQQLLDELHALSAEQAANFSFAMGPMSFDFAGFLELRLNEVVLHTWDVEVMTDPAAALPSDGTQLIIDNLQTLVRYTGKPNGTRTVSVRTASPARDFLINYTDDAVSLTPAKITTAPDVVMDSEAFIRLLYGRLDPDHTPPAIAGVADLGSLRATFPGP